MIWMTDASIRRKTPDKLRATDLSLRTDGHVKVTLYRITNKNQEFESLFRLIFYDKPEKYLLKRSWLDKWLYEVKTMNRCVFFFCFGFFSFFGSVLSSLCVASCLSILLCRRTPAHEHVLQIHISVKILFWMKRSPQQTLMFRMQKCKHRY